MCRIMKLARKKISVLMIIAMMASLVGIIYNDSDAEAAYDSKSLALADCKDTDSNGNPVAWGANEVPEWADEGLETMYSDSFYIGTIQKKNCIFLGTSPAEKIPVEDIDKIQVTNPCGQKEEGVISPRYRYNEYGEKMLQDDGFFDVRVTKIGVYTIEYDGKVGYINADSFPELGLYSDDSFNDTSLISDGDSVDYYIGNEYKYYIHLNPGNDSYDSAAISNLKFTDEYDRDIDKDIASVSKIDDLTWSISVSKNCNCICNITPIYEIVRDGSVDSSNDIFYHVFILAPAFKGVAISMPKINEEYEYEYPDENNYFMWGDEVTINNDTVYAVAILKDNNSKMLTDYSNIYVKKDGKRVDQSQITITKDYSGSKLKTGLINIIFKEVGKYEIYDASINECSPLTMTVKYPKYGIYKTSEVTDAGILPHEAEYGYRVEPGRSYYLLFSDSAYSDENVAKIVVTADDSIEEKTYTWKKGEGELKITLKVPEDTEAESSYVYTIVSYDKDGNELAYDTVSMSYSKKAITGDSNNELNESVVEPVETEKPEETEAPKVTDTPEETFAPEESSEPLETINPDETLKPEETVKPDETLAPEETGKPGEVATETDKPSESQDPAVTENPGVLPIASNVPAASLSPQIIVNPNTANVSATSSANPTATVAPADEDDDGLEYEEYDDTKPAKVKIKSLKKSGAKAIVVKWAKVKKAKGYQVQYSTDKKFKKNKKSKNTTKTKLTAKKLKKKVYYVRVRAFKKINYGKIYGKWSKVKKIKVK